MRRRNAALLACALAACSSDEPGPLPDAVAVDIRLDGADLEITRVYPVRQFPFVRNPAQTFLRYELRAADGSVVSAGHIPDPRAARAFEMDGSMDSLEFKQEWGSASLRLPATSGELVLLDTTGNGVWDLELARAPFDPTATAGRLQQHLRAPLILFGDVLGDHRRTLVGPGPRRHPAADMNPFGSVFSSPITPPAPPLPVQSVGRFGSPTTITGRGQRGTGNEQPDI